MNTQAVTDEFLVICVTAEESFPNWQTHPSSASLTMREQDPQRWEAFKQSVKLCGLQAPVLASESESGMFTVLAGNDRMRCLEELHAEGLDVAIRMKLVDPEDVSDERVVVDSLLSNHMRRSASKSHQAIVIWEQREQLIDQLGGEESFSQLKRKGDRLVDAVHRITGVGRTYLAHASVVCGRRHRGLRDAVFHEQLAIQIAAEAASPGQFASEVIENALEALRVAFEEATVAGQSTRQAKQAGKQAFEQTLVASQTRRDEAVPGDSVRAPASPPQQSTDEDAPVAASHAESSGEALDVDSTNTGPETESTSTVPSPATDAPYDAIETIAGLATETDTIGGRLQEAANECDPEICTPIKAIAKDLGSCANRIRTFCDPGQHGVIDQTPSGPDSPGTASAMVVPEENSIETQTMGVADMLLDLEEDDPPNVTMEAVDELSFSDETEFAELADVVGMET